MGEEDHRFEHDFKHAISNGPNARPRDEPIGQTAGGLPDDSSKPVEISPEEERRIADSILHGPADVNVPGRIEPDRAADDAPGDRKPGEDLGERQQQLLDEAIEETFPGSDPISPSRIV